MQPGDLNTSVHLIDVVTSKAACARTEPDHQLTHVIQSVTCKNCFNFVKKWARDMLDTKRGSNFTKVLIAVAIDEQGRYSAVGWANATRLEDTVSEYFAMEYDRDHSIIHFVEAWVPTPQSVTVQGEVVKP